MNVGDAVPEWVWITLFFAIWAIIIGSWVVMLVDWFA